MSGLLRFILDGEAFALHCQAGGSPAASHFSLLRQRKVTKRTATPSPRPYASLRATGGARLRRREKQLAALKQVFPLDADSISAPRRGQQGLIRKPNQTLTSSASRLRLPGSVPEFTPHPVEAGPSSAAGGGRSGQTCLSRRRVVWTAAGVEQRRLLVAKRRDPDGGSPFFSSGFFGEAKKSNSPAGARPGMRLQAHRKDSLLCERVPAGATPC